ncbi:branched-chain amino acid ABC transporter permease [Burkholderia sp. SRS-W-2-2016]|uniref:branched-chain amino acid ABC transporter permease n=1 Tax=Burkholderia sp. SRS-W-2-2016 TaxID=1926878 RepID=UPI000A64C434|nr:branched-chain amino acid ABC transporter permease [Burkholderia sp. SRS-W-2-2016]
MMPTPASAPRARPAPPVPRAADAASRRASYVDRLGWLLAVLLLALPVYAALSGQPFLVVLFARIAILAIAVLSLDLMLGVGGMVSFGHALYFGLGAYITGMLAQHGVVSGGVHLLITLLVCALVALVTGAIALRTSGIAFIMITLAFAQMFYFFAVSLREYGGDDGFALAGASRFGAVSLGDPVTLYYVAAGLLIVLMLFGRRFLKSAAGMTLGGIRINERRMRALGVPTTRMKLAVFVSAAMLCGVAGMLFANLTQFVAPSYMSWTMSGDLIVMVVIGGAGTFVGPLVGTLAIVLLEEGLKSVTEHWMLVMGPLIVIAVLLSRRGLIGLVASLDARRERRENERKRAAQGGAQ